jgi:hypothetical protein
MSDTARARFERGESSSFFRVPPDFTIRPTMA